MAASTRLRMDYNMLTGFSNGPAWSGAFLKTHRALSTQNQREPVPLPLVGDY